MAGYSRYQTAALLEGREPMMPLIEATLNNAALIDGEQLGGGSCR